MGLGAMGALWTGFAGLAGAVLAFIGGSGPAMGACLIASALAFGLLANALYRE